MTAQTKSYLTVRGLALVTIVWIIIINMIIKLDNYSYIKVALLKCNWYDVNTRNCNSWIKTDGYRFALVNISPFYLKYTLRTSLTSTSIFLCGRPAKKREGIQIVIHITCQREIQKPKECDLWSKGPYSIAEDEERDNFMDLDSHKEWWDSCRSCF